MSIIHFPLILLSLASSKILIFHKFLFHLFFLLRFIIWKSDLTDKMKRSFFPAVVVSILLYGCTAWMLTKRLEKKLHGNYTRMLRAILNKSWRQHPTKHQLYGHLPPITKTIKVRRTRHAGHCLKSRDEIISDVLLWTLTYGRAKAGRPARTYIQRLCEDTGCSPEYLPEAMNDKEKWRERVRDIRASGMTWWWWWYHPSFSHLIIHVIKDSSSWDQNFLKNIRRLPKFSQSGYQTTIPKLEWIKGRKGRHEVSLPFNQIYIHTHTHTHIYIYIYNVCVCVCVWPIVFHEDCWNRQKKH